MEFRKVSLSDQMYGIYNILYIYIWSLERFLSVTRCMVYTIYYIIYMEFGKVSLSDQMYGIYNILYNIY